MNQFIDDMIHMTEGEKLIHYWWVWLGMIVAAVIVIWFTNKKKRK